jgi:hypothetical protein
MLCYLTGRRLTLDALNALTAVLLESAIVWEDVQVWVLLFVTVDSPSARIQNQPGKIMVELEN